MLSRPRIISSTLFGILGAGTAAYLFIPDKSRSAPTVDDASLSPCHFTRATLTSSEQSGPNTKLLRLKVHGLPAHNHPSLLPPIWSVFIKDDDIQVERPYTPLEGIDEHGRMLFWIKKYPKGEVGRWLHSKRVGDQIEFRGPLSTWAWKEDAWDEIVMISGGTGITPFYQLLHSSLAKARSTRFTLLHSSATPSELPPPAILGPLRAYAKENPEKFTLHLFVGKTEGESSADLPPFQVGRINKPVIQRALGLDRTWWQNPFSRTSVKAPRKTLFLVCGPEPMVAAIAGPYGRNFSQGDVGGVLAELGYTSSEVHKL